jgi:hypothetical protein
VRRSLVARVGSSIPRWFAPFSTSGCAGLQFALGPLAWLANLPFIGQVPVITAATNAIGGVAAATVLTAATIGSGPVSAEAPDPPPAVHADVRAGGTDVDDNDD